MRLRTFVRGGAVLPVALACSVLMASPAMACGKQYDDGFANTTADFDFTDDIARKTLDGPLVNSPLAGTAKLTVRGTPYGCTTNASVFRITLNGTPIANFNCSAFWGSSATFSFNAALVQPGVATNTFVLVDTDADWNTGINLDVDTNSFYGRSSISTNGTTVNGELIWRLDTPGLVCNPV